jgi:hypothetical protein
VGKLAVFIFLERLLQFAFAVKAVCYICKFEIKITVQFLTFFGEVL